MDNKIVFTIIAVAVILVGAYLYSTAESAVVTVQGISEMTVQPDTASVYLNIEARAGSAEEAKNLHSETSDKVLSSLLKIGLERKDIQTLNYNIYPEYDWRNGRNEIKGYLASEQLIIKVEDFDKVARIVDAGVDAGALIQSINFELSQEKQNLYKAQVLESAAKDARTKAEAVVAGTGGKIGNLVSVSSQEFNYNPWVYYSNSGADMATSVAEAKTAAVNIAPRDMQITASVTAQYKVR